tara:strand:- start:118 stop:750 length:633 start_codon:yes stop_codon:yes gene_type:complete
MINFHAVFYIFRAIEKSKGTIYKIYHFYRMGKSTRREKKSTNKRRGKLRGKTKRASSTKTYTIRQRGGKKKKGNKDKEKKQVRFDFSTSPETPDQVDRTLTPYVHSTSKTTTPLVYGYIYSDSCGFCKKMKKDWTEVNEQCNKKGITSKNIGINYDTEVAKFNEAHPNANLEYSGFPTIFRLEKEGDPVQYYNNPDRTSSALMKWVIHGN